MMPGENVPTVTIKLDRPRRLAFTLGAMRRIKDRLGTLDFEGDGTAPTDDAVEKLGAYIWACLVNADREGLTVEDVEEMIHPGNMEATWEAFSAAMEASQPKPKGAEGNARAAAPVRRKGKPRKSTSTRSGPSASTTSA